MNQKTEGLFSNTNYKLLLQLLQTKTSNPKSGVTSIHPREWIPPPCLTSAPQKDLRKDCKFLNIDSSSDEMDQVDHQRSRKNRMKEISPQREQEKISHKLKHLKKDQELMKDAQLKLRSGAGLSSLNDFIHKWRALEEKTSKHLELDGVEAPAEAPQSDSCQQSIRKDIFDRESFGGASADDHVRHLSTKRDGDDDQVRHLSTKRDGDDDQVRHLSTKRDGDDVRRTEKALLNLERNFRQAKEEEERLRRNLKRLKKEDKSKENKRPAVKLKKPLNHIEYKVLAMKRRYEDLLQYLARLESKNSELRKENEVLHTTLKEENEYPAREKILVLEQELQNRNNALEIVTAQLRVQDSIQEENTELKSKIEDLKSKIEDLKRFTVNRERERDLKEEEFERGWAKKATDMKILYEKAVQGYKKQLQGSRTSYDALEQRLRTLIQYYEKNEKRLIESFEGEIKSLKEDAKSSESDQSSKISDDKEEEKFSLLKLETLVEKKDSEIALLKEALVKLTAEQKVDASEHFQKEVLEKLSDIMEKATVVDENCLESLKEAMRTIFEDFTETQNKVEINKADISQREIDQLRKELMEKHDEIFVLKRDLGQVEKNLDKLTLEREQNIKINTVERGVLDAEVLREFPRLLKENEAKLKTSESACHEYQIEVKLCQERLRNTANDLETKKERISELEENIKGLTGGIKKQEREKEKLENKMEILEAQIEKKNRILEKNSSQIEERIRESRSLGSQMERLREEHNREMADLKERNNIRHSDSKLQESQTLNVRLESQLNAFRSEKLLGEKMTKKQLRFLEDQVSQLKIRNTTLQKHLQTIQDTYKSMFGLEGHLLPFLAIPPTSAFPNRDLHLETNGTNLK